MARTESAEPVLELRGIGLAYGRTQVVFDLDLAVEKGQITALLGHNGAGKTTTLAGAFGLVPARTGTVSLSGTRIDGWSAAKRARAGLAFIPAVDFVFADLTVEQNLRLSAFAAKSGTSESHDRLAEVLRLWPILEERRSQVAGTLSGGQRRMLSLAIALMTDPSVLLLDEPSLGLSPVLVDQLFDDLRILANERGIAVLLVEQAVHKALSVADYAYVIRSGRVIAHEPAAILARSASLWELF
ncbi:ABC transporter ATP-binding protein [Microbacterium sp. CPCC 204701]|uniref:ABC transporter ATP-binding protein n=1 Tax=Microbacterium sp. CPCC 204701 TaxID=2493084 RepID=UPI00197C098D|nr:ABC transporter ATP-binding protein [Microbacterium sp. CPCC 204701]